MDKLLELLDKFQKAAIKYADLSAPFEIWMATDEQIADIKNDAQLAYNDLITIKNQIIQLFKGTKKYNTQSNIGNVKYVVNFHDGLKTHSDGSEFYDIRCFKNKKRMKEFIKELESNGYVKEA